MFSHVREFWKALRNTPEAFRLVWAAGRRAALAGVGLTLVAALLPAAQAWAGKLIIDAIVLAIGQGMEPMARLRAVAPYLALDFALLLVGSITGQIRGLDDGAVRALHGTAVSR